MRLPVQVSSSFAVIVRAHCYRIAAVLIVLNLLLCAALQTAASFAPLSFRASCHIDAPMLSASLQLGLALL